VTIPYEGLTHLALASEAKEKTKEYHEHLDKLVTLWKQVKKTGQLSTSI